MKWSSISKSTIQNTVFLLTASLALTSAAFAIDIQVAEAPTDNLDLTVGAINSAKKTVLLNIYELTSPQIVDAIDGKIKSGVKVVILEEGSPVGGLSAAAKGVQSQIAQAMQGISGDHLYEMTKSTGGIRRFVFDHAKYAVIDDVAVLIGSENYSPTGNPSAGSVGNRGWEVFIQDPTLATDFKGTFLSDISLSAGDIIEITHNNGQVNIDELTDELMQTSDESALRTPTNPSPARSHKPRPIPTSTPPTPIDPTPSHSHRPRPTPTPTDTALPNPKPTRSHHPKPTPTTTPKPNPTYTPSPEPAPTSTGSTGAISGYPTYQADSIEKITSPDTSVSGIVAAINQAKSSIDIEQMTFDSAWKGASSSPIYDAVVAAAKRGVKVRALLNDEHVFDHPGHPAKPTNHTTVGLLNQASKNISAKIANLKAMGVDYIHNKGMLIDGNKTLISSINWDENSFEKNREAAVLISSNDIFKHYETLFDNDWNVSGGTNIMEENFSFNELSSNPIALDKVECPTKLDVSLSIGQLTLDDSSDQDMLSIQNKTFAGEYTKTNDASSCVYNASAAVERTIGNSYLEIRTSSAGSVSIIFEGYTPKTGKLFSVRTKVNSNTTAMGKFTAQVYDASAPARELIGSAAIILKAE